MTTGFGLCSRCGTPAAGPGRTFCASCGAALDVPPPAAAPVPPAAAPVPPAAMPAPPAAMPAPPPYASVAPAQPYWAMPPAAAPAGPARSSAAPLIVALVGVLLVVALVGVGGLLLIGSKGSGADGSAAAGSAQPAGSANPTGGSRYPGSIVFSPSAVGCGEPLTVTIKLPASVKETDLLIGRVNGRETSRLTVFEAGMKKQDDGSWMLTNTGPAGCLGGTGLQTVQLLDAAGKVLAEGSYTLVERASAEPTVMATRKPTPTPTVLPKSGATVEPSSFSCSAPNMVVNVTFRLPASIPGGNVVMKEIDGQQLFVTKVEESFAPQPDGTWLYYEMDSSAHLCDSLAPGEHTIGIFDYSDNPIVETTFTITP